MFTEWLGFSDCSGFVVAFIDILWHVHVCYFAQVNRKQKDGSVTPVNCPLAEAQYTYTIQYNTGGVDQFDQHRELYSMSWHSCHWWLRI